MHVLGFSQFWLLQPESSIEGGKHATVPFVFFQAYLRMLPDAGLDHFDTVIRRTVIYHDDLVGAPRLLQDGIQTGRKILPVIVIRHNDGERRSLDVRLHLGQWEEVK